ncbi:hypothetical protein LOTGIDRAFT_152593 [Lottia gigantea]|uniref:Major facilitator superfamily (MFS) profile domain-containing protein n=1 Tax=Lottia gigantea TaxID=225164 RepID=V4A108_LOTGI|nr:hypothetical protein LOTGIDRAFT_152593 [Lottia gigantea]ESO97503.1 hypothetical protein LOTGIDRAFT_152593 [Lottia gigantea]
MVWGILSKQGLITGVVFFLYKAGESMLDATIRPYIIHAICRDNFPENTSICVDTSSQSKLQQENIQERASTYLIYYRILVNVPAIVLGLVWGAWSDKHSRKLPMMVPSLGSVFAVLLYVASLRQNEWTIALILCGSAVQGIFGKSSVITMAVNSHLSDITERKHRTGALSRLLAMNYFGLFAGSLLSGTIQEYTDIKTTLTVVCFLHAFSVLITVCCIQESEQEEPDSGKSGLCTPTGFRDSITVHLKSSKLNTTKIFIILVIMTTLNQTCKVGDQDVTVLFVRKYPLSWPTPWYGYLLSVEYTMMGVTLMVLTPLLTSYFNLADSTIIILGTCCKLIRTLWAGFCYETWMVFTSVVIGAIGGMLVSAVRSLMSKHVDDSDVGKAFAVLACAETASKVLGSVIFNYTYGATVSIYPGFAYLMEMVLYLIVLILAIWLHKDVMVSSAYNLLKGNVDERPTEAETILFD